MSDYGDGEAGQVENESYCLKKSVEAKTNETFNREMGYHAMDDLANTKPFPAEMKGEKANKQLGPEAASNNYNYSGMKR